MDFSFTEEQQTLKDMARKFAQRYAQPDAIRDLITSELGYDESVWQRAAGELGWPSLIVPEAYDGAGLGFVELVGILEEMGRSLLASPLLGTVLGTAALNLSDNDSLKTQWLGRIAFGEATTTVAWSESGACNADSVTCIATPEGAGFRLDGQCRFVLNGHATDLLIVFARLPGTTGDSGLSLFAVPAGTPGVETKRVITMDATRPSATLTMDGVIVPQSHALIPPGDGAETLERLLNIASLCLAAEQVGGSQACLDMAVDYAKTRVQFGRPIGSFQAIKHKCADMLLLVESARSAAYYAAWAADHSQHELAEYAAIAKSYCSDAFFRCASENIQIHGGIGFTWEHDAHLHFKRAKASQHLFEPPRAHRERLAAQLLD